MRRALGGVVAEHLWRAGAASVTVVHNEATAVLTVRTAGLPFARIARILAHDTTIATGGPGHTLHGEGAMEGNEVVFHLRLNP